MHYSAAKWTLLTVSVTNFAEKSVKNPAQSKIIRCGSFYFFLLYKKMERKPLRELHVFDEWIGHYTPIMWYSDMQLTNQNQEF